jgi:hypothetical protein
MEESCGDTHISVWLTVASYVMDLKGKKVEVKVVSVLFLNWASRHARRIGGVEV